MVMYERSQELKKDDDLCVHVLLDMFGMLPGEKLGAHLATEFKPPTYNPAEVMHTVKELIIKRRQSELALQQFKRLGVVQRYMERMDARARKRFIEHLKRYLRLYEHGNPLEIGRTPRYSHVTGKSELGVFATHDMPKGMPLTAFISGDLAPYTEEESMEDRDRDSDLLHLEDMSMTAETSKSGATKIPGRAKKDFSVILSGRRRGREEVFLGPARFVNHDCNPNCAFLSAEGSTVSFRTLRPIKAGEEITSFYKDDYFGIDNCECLCGTCEKEGRGWFAGRPRPSSDPSDLDKSKRASGAASKDRSPLGSTSANSPANYDSLRNTPESLDSADENQHERRRHPKRHQPTTVEEDKTSVRLLWGSPARWERYCIKCKGGIEVERKGAGWVDLEKRCARCVRHERIFAREWPNKPSLEDPPRPYVPHSQAVANPRPQLDATAERERALRKAYKADPNRFDREHPGLSQKWRAEKRAKKGRSYQIEEFELELVRTYGSVPSSFVLFKQKIYGVSSFLRTTIEARNQKVVLVRHRDFPMIRAENVLELMHAYKAYDALLPDQVARVELVDCEPEYRGIWVHVDSIQTLARDYKIDWLLQRFLAHQVDLRWPVPVPAPAPPPARVAPPSIVHPKRAPSRPPMSTDKGRGRASRASVVSDQDLVDPDLPKAVCELNEAEIVGPSAYMQAHPVPLGARKVKGGLPRAVQAPPILVGRARTPRKVPYRDWAMDLYEIEIKVGSRTHVIGRMPYYNWIHLSAMLDIVGLDENDKNRVYGKIPLLKNKQIYSVPAGTSPLPSWNGVWCTLGEATKIAEHFDLLDHLEYLLLPRNAFDKHIEAAAAREDATAGSSSLRSPYKSSVRSPVKGSPKRSSHHLSPRRPVRAEDRSDDDAADDEAESPSDLAARERELAEELFGPSDGEPEDGPVPRDVRQEDAVMTSREEEDAVEHGSALDLAPPTPGVGPQNEMDRDEPMRADTIAIESSTSDEDDEVVFDHEVNEIECIEGAVAPPPEFHFDPTILSSDSETEDNTKITRLFDPAPAFSIASTSARPNPSGRSNSGRKMYPIFSAGSSDQSDSSPRLISSERDIPPRPRSRSSTRTLSPNVSTHGARGIPVFALASSSTTAPIFQRPELARNLKRPSTSSRRHSNQSDVISISSASEEDKPPLKKQAQAIAMDLGSSSDDSDIELLTEALINGTENLKGPGRPVKREQSRVPGVVPGVPVASGSGSRGGFGPPKEMPKRLVVSKRKHVDKFGHAVMLDEIELSD